MIDIGTQLRKSYYDVLHDQVLVNSGEVPIVDEKLDTQLSEHDLYMLIDAQAERPTDNKTKYASEIDITIRIVNRRQATNSKTAVEDIANQMLTLLFPAKNQWALTVSDPLHLTYARLQEADYEFQKTDAGFNIMKRMVFRNRITQS